MGIYHLKVLYLSGTNDKSARLTFTCETPCREFWKGWLPFKIYEISLTARHYVTSVVNRNRLAGRFLHRKHRFQQTLNSENGRISDRRRGKISIEYQNFTTYRIPSGNHMIHLSFLPFVFFSFQTAFVTDEVTNIVKEVNICFCYIYISIKNSR